MVPVPRIFLILALLLAVARPAHAQLGGLGNGLGGAIGGLPGTSILRGPLGVDRTTGNLAQGVRGAVDSVKRDLVGRPVNSPILEHDPRGAAIVKGEVLAVSPNAESLAIVRRLNFMVLRQDTLGALGVTSVTLQAPDGMSATEALAALRQADPNGVYDYGHIYNPTGQSDSAVSTAMGAFPKSGDIRIGMIDGGLDQHHPALSDSSIVTRAFDGQAPAPPSSHGTAIASLLVGQAGKFSGYLPGARLYAADVFGGVPTGGSAADIARALNWLAENGVPVTNISLAGPPNALLAAAVKAFVVTGHVLVAAVGNDGPAAPPNYPAAYDGVIGVTAVDSGLHLQIDANHNAIRFAAIGVQVEAATLPRGYAGMTGTSYAAPAVAARIGLLLEKPNADGAHAALERLTAEATHLPDLNLLYLSPPPKRVFAQE
jgi:subtilisin family serine protease